MKNKDFTVKAVRKNGDEVDITNKLFPPKSENGNPNAYMHSVG
jgi:hypothetical protein